MAGSLSAVAILIALFAGPIVLAPIERNLEIWFFVVGLSAATLARIWSGALLIDALRAPLPVTIAVLVGGVLFGYLRPVLDRGFAHLRPKITRPALTASTVFIIGVLSAVISAIVAALVLVEAVALLELGPPTRDRVAVAGCFAIGLGSALTPAGGPISALATSALNLPPLYLLWALGPWIIPTIIGLSVLAGYFARGDYDLIAEADGVRETAVDAIFQGVRVFIFVAGLVLVSNALEPVADRWLLHIGRSTLFWANMSSAALDNSTLVALEARSLGRGGLPWAMTSLLIAGGMLIPGNIPNIVCAGKLKIRSLEWARLGIPLGLAMLGIAFALLRLT